MLSGQLKTNLCGPRRHGGWERTEKESQGTFATLRPWASPDSVDLSRWEPHPGLGSPTSWSRSVLWDSVRRGIALQIWGGAGKPGRLRQWREKRDEDRVSRTGESSEHSGVAGAWQGAGLGRLPGLRLTEPLLSVCTWVCCRRPRAAASDVPQDGLLLHGPFARKPKRIRTAFSPSQLLRLERAFEKNHYVVGAERKQLAGSLSLSETQVILPGPRPALRPARSGAGRWGGRCGGGSGPRPGLAPRCLPPKPPARSGSFSPFPPTGLRLLRPATSEQGGRPSRRRRPSVGAGSGGPSSALPSRPLPWALARLRGDPAWPLWLRSCSWAKPAGPPPSAGSVG